MLGDKSVEAYSVGILVTILQEKFESSFADEMVEAGIISKLISFIVYNACPDNHCAPIVESALAMLRMIARLSLDNRDVIRTGVEGHLGSGMKAQQSKVREGWITLACSLVSHMHSQSDIKALIDSGFLGMTVDSIGSGEGRSHQANYAACVDESKVDISREPNTLPWLDGEKETRTDGS
jgi:hypothetical protein